MSTEEPRNGPSASMAGRKTEIITGKMTSQQIRDLADGFSRAVARSERERKILYHECGLFFCLVNGAKNP